MSQLTLYNGASRVAARREPRLTGPSDGFRAKLPPRLSVNPPPGFLAQNVPRRSAGLLVRQFVPPPAARGCSIISSFQKLEAGCPKNRQARTPALKRLFDFTNPGGVEPEAPLSIRAAVGRPGCHFFSALALGGGVSGFRISVSKSGFVASRSRCGYFSPS